MADAMTSRVSRGTGNSEQHSLKHSLETLINGEIIEDEYFCIVLSLLGVEETKVSFINIVESVRKTHPRLHKNLMGLYITNFSEQNSNGISIPTSSLDDAMQRDFALQLSLDEAVIVAKNPSVSKPASSNAAPEDKTYISKLEGPAGSSLTSRQKLKQYKSEPRVERRTTWSSVVGGQEGKQSRLSGYSQFQYVPSDVTNQVPSEHLVQEAVSKTQDPVKFIGSNVTKDISSKSNCSRNDEITNLTVSRKGRKAAKRRNNIERPLLQRPVLLWFRRDLRIYDNPALIEACKIGGPVLPVFLWSEVEEGPLAAGGATKVWLHHALKSLNQCLKDRYNSQIIFLRTKSCKQELTNLVQTTNASTVIWNDLYEPHLRHRDDSICEALERKTVRVKRFHSYCLHNPYSVKTESVGMRGIGSVSHFMACARMSSDNAIPLPQDPPPSVPVPERWPNSQTLDQLELDKMPIRKNGNIIDWACVMRKTWDFTENAAYNALEDFLADRVKRYEKESARSDTPNTSGLSPYLHFGQISPQTVYHEAKHCKSPKFIRKLAWRDLSYWLLTLFPKMPTLPMRPHYKHQRWSLNRIHLKAWQKGKTGYPLVDAAMRELWVTGWINNYMRHVVASFLIAYLHLHWVEGYNWFQDTLLDADVAINAMMWQNGGMSGLDHWNFVMHPVDAAMTCDPKGDYVRRWVPELAKLPDAHIHKPWTCPPSILKRCGVQLGVNYPQRIITDLEEAREQSLRDVVEVRLLYGGGWVDDHGNDIVPLPSGRKIPVITRKEFKYKTANPEARDNPHTAVLKGYRSRERDEAVAFANKVDFLCSTMDECVKRKERYDRFSKMDAY